MSKPSPGDDANPWLTVMPGVFVLLWSTGFIGARLGLPHAEPFTFLFYRFVILIGVLGVAAAIWRAPWPKSGIEVLRIAISGILVHAVYLGGVFAAIAKGMPAALAALIVGLQPLLTAIAAGPFLGERVTKRQWGGFFLGLAGTALVVSEKLSFQVDDVTGILYAVGALFGITAGTLYQKRHGSGMDLRTGSLIQFAASAVIVGVLAVTMETMVIAWTGEFVFALLWLVVVLSLGAITLLFILIKRGEASKVASLFYLVPPVTAVTAYLLFGETLGAIALLGMGVTVVGVALVIRN